MEIHFAHKIRNLYSDNGGEFVALRSYLSEHGISHFTSPPHTPEHNGIAERKHCHIVETSLTLLHQSPLPLEYWPYAFAAAVYLINRLPSQVTGDVLPYEKLFAQSPNYLKLRVFGCLCFPWLHPYTKHKLEDRSLPCIFLGYSLTQSAYLCLHRPTGHCTPLVMFGLLRLSFRMLLLFLPLRLAKTHLHQSILHPHLFLSHRPHSYNPLQCLPRAELSTCNSCRHRLLILFRHNRMMRL